MFSFINNRLAKGASSVPNLGSFIFGISGTIICLVVVMAPFKILEIVSDGSINFLGFNIEKNGALGILLISGVIIAVITQPAAGYLSDRLKSSMGQRLPFILIGGFGTAISLFALYFASSFYTLIISWIVIQFFANLGEGPANALLKDHVDEKKFGVASGQFNLLRVLGSIFTLILVLQLMNLYYSTGNYLWVLGSIILLSFLISISTIWSYLSLRNSKSIKIEEKIQPDDIKVKSRKINLILIVITLSITLTAFSSLQSYAMFFVRDVLNLENPTTMMTYIIVVLGVSIGLAMIPAGKLSDKFNRKYIIFGGGLIGCASCFIMTIFHSQIMVLILCGGIGLAVGTMFGTIWALTNDIISRKNAGKQIGWLAFSFLFSSLGARGSGILIDYLNNYRDNLGYFALISLSGICFLVAPMTASMIKK